MKHFGVMILCCLLLSGCAIGKTLDCVDYKRFDNCIVFDGVKKKRYAAKRQARAEQAFYPSYKPQKVQTPSKTWGD